MGKEPRRKVVDWGFSFGLVSYKSYFIFKHLNIEIFFSLLCIKFFSKTKKKRQFPETEFAEAQMAKLGSSNSRLQ